MELINCPKHWEELRKERLFLATKECAKNVVRCINQGFFKDKQMTESDRYKNLQNAKACLLYVTPSERHEGYLNFIISGVDRKDAEMLIWLNNVWKPKSPMWNTIHEPMFSTKDIMMNVEVISGDCCDIYSRHLIRA